MSAWRDHHGGACPVHPQAMVLLDYRSGWKSLVEQRAGGFVWTHRNDPFDIVAYQVVSVPEEVRR